jgi:predicted transcriptional regulator
MCDFERPKLARIEAGNTNPTYFTLSKIIIALEVSMIELIDI